ncbi:hypothetical protein L915_07955 [Phytophthora nicotianae]|uniref:Uncharacterized protein n=1 Tax=Phytophthora nicotianae TaxID=4792 RepID=W2GXN2_PHYNI|nr:hypothetical protein L915_07955 [Phytophthora nicotianae]
MGAVARRATESTAVKITLRRSKKDQYGQGTTRILNQSGHNCICPVVAAKILLGNAQRLILNLTDAICSTSKRKVISADDLAKVIKCSAAATGEDPARFHVILFEVVVQHRYWPQVWTQQ